MGITGRSTTGSCRQADPQPGQTDPRHRRWNGRPRASSPRSAWAPAGRVITNRLLAGHAGRSARRNGEAARPVPNVEYRVLDAERMDLDDDSCGRRGLPLRVHADGRPGRRRWPRRRRVLRDGGTLAFAVWQTPRSQPLGGRPRDDTRPAGPTCLRPSRERLGIFALESPTESASLAHRGRASISPSWRRSRSTSSYPDVPRPAGRARPPRRARLRGVVHALPDGGAAGDACGDHGERRPLPRRRRFLHRSRG